MKCLLIISLMLTCSIAAPAQQQPLNSMVTKQVYNLTVDSLQGKWQEEKRLRKKRALTFKDTTYVFITGNEAQLRQGKRVNTTSVIQVLPFRRISFAGDTYTIDSLNTKRLVLRNDTIVRKFIKVAQFEYDKLREAYANTKNFGNPITFSLQQLAGNWRIENTVIFNNTQPEEYLHIKQISIQKARQLAAQTNALITYAKNGIDETDSCTVKINNNQFILQQGATAVIYYMYALQANKIAFGDKNTVVYEGVKFE